MPGDLVDVVRDTADQALQVGELHELVAPLRSAFAVVIQRRLDQQPGNRDAMLLRQSEKLSSATDDPGVGGLNAFGEQVVATMNELGMLIDLSHCADTTVEHVTRFTTAPLFFSHSGARALCDHPRNVTDATLKAVSASGGIVMVVFLPEFLSKEYGAWSAARKSAQSGWTGPQAPAREAAWLADNPEPPCGIREISDHIDHIRNVAGIDHVGIGSDFDGMTPPDDMASVDRYPALLAELDRRGWSSSDLAALTHGNMVRVLRATEACAGKARNTEA